MKDSRICHHYLQVRFPSVSIVPSVLEGSLQWLICRNVTCVCNMLHISDSRPQSPSFYGKAYYLTMHDGKTHRFILLGAFINVQNLPRPSSLKDVVLVGHSGTTLYSSSLITRSVYSLICIVNRVQNHAWPRFFWWHANIVAAQKHMEHRYPEHAINYSWEIPSLCCYCSLGLQTQISCPTSMM